MIAEDVRDVWRCLVRGGDLCWTWSWSVLGLHCWPNVNAMPKSVSGAVTGGRLVIGKGELQDRRSGHRQAMGVGALVV